MSTHTIRLNCRRSQKWEEHNRSLKQASSSTSSSPAAAHAPAAQAVSRWGRVGKKARQALRRANVSAVMDLELQLLDFLQRPGAASGGEQLSMPMEDGFGRLLVHGLAEFHGLLAAHKAAAGDEPAVVVVYAHRRPPRASAGGHASGDEDSGDASHGKLSNTASQARQQPQEDAVAWPRGGDDDVPALGHAAGAVMCCDVLQALQEVGHLGVGHRELIARIALHAGYQHHPHHEPTAAVSLGAAAGGGAAAVVCA